MQKVVVLVNIGTPESPFPKEVGEYLDEFLMDRWVLQMPTVFRFLLVKGLIVPRRKFTSALNYQKVWQKEGSPLLIYTEQLARKVQEKVGSSTKVFVAMRYGKPSFEEVMDQIKDMGEVSVALIPLYPQYAESSVRTAVERWQTLWDQLKIKGEFQVMQPFYDQPFFLDSLIEKSKTYLDKFPLDHLLISYHGLPELHIRRTEGVPGHCLRGYECCQTISTANSRCYRAHCYQTSVKLSSGLNLKPEDWTMTFQSRLGPTRWIQPSTEETVLRLASEGVQRLAIVCPSFVVDGLETLEEVGIGLRDKFLSAGGKEFLLVPCLNGDEKLAQGFAMWSETIKGDHR